MTREKLLRYGKEYLHDLETACCKIGELHLNFVRESIKALEQEPRKGHWINKQHIFESCSAECSSCHKQSNGYMYANGFSLECKYYDFCPNCGAKMVEPQESED